MSTATARGSSDRRNASLRTGRKIDLAPKIAYDRIQIKWLDMTPQLPSREKICGLREAAGRPGERLSHRSLLRSELEDDYQKRTFLI
jgi:hypothetical protein